MVVGRTLDRPSRFQRRIGARRLWCLNAGMYTRLWRIPLCFSLRRGRSVNAAPRLAAWWLSEDYSPAHFAEAISAQRLRRRLNSVFHWASTWP